MLEELPIKEMIFSMNNDQECCIVSIDDMHIYCDDWRAERERHIPYLSLALEPAETVEAPYNKILCILAHLCHYYRKRREAQEKRLAELSTVSKNGLATAKAERKLETGSQRSVASRGYDIDADNIQLFAVTPRTVKRISGKERASSYGWKMPTHIRRGHLHRYWVGSGESRHLEERWLDAMIVNKDQEPVAHVHTVKNTSEDT